MVNKQRRHRATADRRAMRLAVAAMGFLPLAAHASLFTGDTLDKVADVMAWVVICVVPIIGIAVFWIVHVLPEKIAHKRHHPQTAAIQTLCLLSLVFGGLLWPIAWLWAYTKPVFYKMAYGQDRVDPAESHGDAAPPRAAAPPGSADLPHLTDPVEHPTARAAGAPQSESDVVRADLAAATAGQDPRRSQRGWRYSCPAHSLDPPARPKRRWPPSAA